MTRSSLSRSARWRSGAAGLMIAAASFTMTACGAEEEPLEDEGVVEEEPLEEEEEEAD
jgi:hypothetical protein